MLQGDKFSAQVAALESEVKALKADNASLTKDNKTCYNQIRAKDRELDAAAKQVKQAHQTEIQNKVSTAATLAVVTCTISTATSIFTLRPVQCNCSGSNGILDLSRQWRLTQESTRLTRNHQHKAAFLMPLDLLFASAAGKE